MSFFHKRLTKLRLVVYLFSFVQNTEWTVDPKCIIHKVYRPLPAGQHQTSNMYGTFNIHSRKFYGDRFLLSLLMNDTLRPLCRMGRSMQSQRCLCSLGQPLQRYWFSFRQSHKRNYSVRTKIETLIYHSIHATNYNLYVNKFKNYISLKIKINLFLKDRSFYFQITCNIKNTGNVI